VRLATKRPDQRRLARAAGRLLIVAEAESEIGWQVAWLKVRGLRLGNELVRQGAKAAMTFVAPDAATWDKGDTPPRPDLTLAGVGRRVGDLRTPAGAVTFVKWIGGSGHCHGNHRPDGRTARA
jgi:hypothetical protein